MRTTASVGRSFYSKPNNEFIGQSKLQAQGMEPRNEPNPGVTFSDFADITTLIPGSYTTRPTIVETTPQENLQSVILKSSTAKSPIADTAQTPGIKSNATLESSSGDDLSVVVPRTFTEILNNPNITVADLIKWNQIIKSNWNEIQNISSKSGSPKPNHYIFYSKANNGTYPLMRFLTEADWVNKETSISDSVYNTDTQLNVFDTIAAGKPAILPTTGIQSANGNQLKSAITDQAQSSIADNGATNTANPTDKKTTYIVAAVVVVILIAVAFSMSK